MEPYYGRGNYYRDDYPPARRNPRSYDPQPPVEYARTEHRVYAVPPAPVSYPPAPVSYPQAHVSYPPAPVSYPAPSYNRDVEVRYYDPTTGQGLPFSGPIQPVQAPTVTRAPPLQIQMPSGPRSPFERGQTYKVVGVEEAPVYHALPYSLMPKGPTYYPY